MIIKALVLNRSWLVIPEISALSIARVAPLKRTFHINSWRLEPLNKRIFLLVLSIRYRRRQGRIFILRAFQLKSEKSKILLQELP